MLNAIIIPSQLSQFVDLKENKPIDSKINKLTLKQLQNYHKLCNKSIKNIIHSTLNIIQKTQTLLENERFLLDKYKNNGKVIRSLWANSPISKEESLKSFQQKKLVLLKNYQKTIVDFQQNHQKTKDTFSKIVDLKRKLLNIRYIFKQKCNLLRRIKYTIAGSFWTQRLKEMDITLKEIIIVTSIQKFCYNHHIIPSTNTLGNKLSNLHKHFDALNNLKLDQ